MIFRHVLPSRAIPYAPHWLRPTPCPQPFPLVTKSVAALPLVANVRAATAAAGGRKRRMSFKDPIDKVDELRKESMNRCSLGPVSRAATLARREALPR